eukprot:3532444-Amphidinium_carterae.1
MMGVMFTMTGQFLRRPPPGTDPRTPKFQKRLKKILAVPSGGFRAEDSSTKLDKVHTLGWKKATLKSFCCAQHKFTQVKDEHTSPSQTSPPQTK